MAFDGSGNFVRLHNWSQDAANNIDINAGEMDGEDNGFAAGLTLCMTRDGQGKTTADLLPAVTNSLNLGSGSFAWASMTAQKVIIGPPASGQALSVTALAGSFAIQAVAGGSVGQSFGIFIRAGTNGSDAALTVTNAAQSATFMNIAGTGNVQIGPPVSGNTLGVTALAGSTAALFVAPVVAGQSNGVFIRAGTNSSDGPLQCVNAAQTQTLLNLFGDGGLVIGSPTGGDKGLGTINCTGLFVNGVAVSVP